MSRRSLLSRIRRQIETMRALAQRTDDELRWGAPAVSAWCAAEHLDHLAKVGTSVFRKIASPDAERLPYGIRPVGRVILLLGWIPRGVGKAPKSMHPSPTTGAQILAALEEQERALSAVEAMTLRSDPIVAHPRFGGLTPLQALRFVAVHNHHHLKIIADVERAR